LLLLEFVLNSSIKDTQKGKEMMLLHMSQVKTLGELHLIILSAATSPAIRRL